MMIATTLSYQQHDGINGRHTCTRRKTAIDMTPKPSLHNATEKLRSYPRDMDHVRKIHFIHVPIVLAVFVFIIVLSSKKFTRTHQRVDTFWTDILTHSF